MLLLVYDWCYRRCMILCSCMSVCELYDVLCVLGMINYHCVGMLCVLLIFVFVDCVCDVCVARAAFWCVACYVVVCYVVYACWTICMIDVVWVCMMRCPCCCLCYEWYVICVRIIVYTC